MWMHYPRVLDIADLLKYRSLFLFGPRQTGKTTYLHERFPSARYFDLLEADTFRELSARPELLRSTLRKDDRLVVIDEIQKLPALLDEVHLLIERDKERRFILTGSSARKLKRGPANLLAGRALVAHMHQLVSSEIELDRLEERLLRGSLPSVVDSAIPFEDLRSYVGNYLREEIHAEALTRSIEAFSRFLEVAATINGELLNFTSVGNDAAVPPRTVQNYFQVLEDTLIGHLVLPYRKTVKRKAVATAKFYFFDIGVVNAILDRRHISPQTDTFGRVLEHQVFLELRAYLDYRRGSEPLTFWRSLSKMEVDFVIGDSLAIEVRATQHVSNSELRPLRALAEEIPHVRKLVVCREKWRRLTDDGIEIIPVNEFFRDLWNDRLGHPDKGSLTE
jgi:uncharacterized protein